MRCLVLGDEILSLNFKGIVIVLVDFLCGLGEGVVDGVVLFSSSSEVVFGVVFVRKLVFVSICSDEVLFGLVCSGVVSVVFGILNVEGVVTVEVRWCGGENRILLCFVHKWEQRFIEIDMSAYKSLAANDFEVAARIQYPRSVLGNCFKSDCSQQSPTVDVVSRMSKPYMPEVMIVVVDGEN
ncbi:hypothetical protein Tco_1280588 [Tanacetum coccineum]